MSKKWNAEYMIPADSNYINRIVGAEFSPSKNSGNPMVTISCEVVSPQEVDIGGEMINIAGVSASNYFTTTVYKEDKVTVDEEKTNNNRERFKEFYRSLELDPETINWDNIDTKPMLGKLVYCLMEPESVEKRKNPSSTQIAAAKAAGRKPEGDIMKNPVTGKPLVQHWPKIRQFFGVAPSDGVAPGGF